MLKKVLGKLRRIAKSKQGAAVYLLILFLLPLMLLVPAAALDFNAYSALHTFVQNGLDSAAQAALSQSTADDYRADKILYVVVNSDDGNNFIDKLKDNIDANFNTNSLITQRSDSGCSLQFIAKVDGLPDTINLDVNVAQNNVAYNGNLSDGGDPTGTDIELNLSTKAKLPFLSKILNVFNLNQGYDNTINLNVNSNIRGIRVRKPEDFQLKDYDSYQGSTDLQP